MKPWISQFSFVLASASPRRRDLVKLLNIPFEITASGVDETLGPGETTPALVARLSRAKAAAAQTLEPDATIVAADTDVELDGTILGKPRDTDEARAMLLALRGRAHSVYGGMTVTHRAYQETRVVHSRVWMREYSEAEIDAYLATGDALDKAAAYGIQHPVFQPVAHIEGCFANVMGLALCHLHNLLAHHGSLPPPDIECHLHPEHDCTVVRLLSARENAAISLR